MTIRCEPIRFLRPGLLLACVVLPGRPAPHPVPGGQLKATRPLGSSGRPIRLVAVGDICLARGVEAEMVKQGRGYPFAAMKATVRNADIAFGNLECCLAVRGEPVPKKYNFRGHPRGALAIAEAGFDVVSLANNHTLDYGKGALAETVDLLRSNGVQAAGGGHSLDDAHAVRVVTVRGVRVGFLAYLGLFPSILPLSADKPAVAMAELTVIRRDVKAAKKQVDFLIVSMHAGKEYHFTHSVRQQEIARAAIDAGADLIVGHHPHVVQDVETYRGKTIYYSLGNFIFDPSPTFIRDGGKGWSAMIEADLMPGRPIVSRLVDLRIVDRQPRPAVDQHVSFRPRSAHIALNPEIRQTKRPKEDPSGASRAIGVR